MTLFERIGIGWFLLGTPFLVGFAMAKGMDIPGIAKESLRSFFRIRRG